MKLNFLIGDMLFRIISTYGEIEKTLDMKNFDSALQVYELHPGTYEIAVNNKTLSSYTTVLLSDNRLGTILTLEPTSAASRFSMKIFVRKNNWIYKAGV